MLFFSSAQSDTGTITITIDNVKNKEGMIRMLLFEKNKGFPDQIKTAFLSREVKISSVPFKLELKNIPLGEYALSVLHDENNNETMDTNFLGIPKEGYGFSNNPSAKFSAPKYEEAAFKLDSVNKNLSIKLNN